MAASFVTLGLAMQVGPPVTSSSAGVASAIPRPPGIPQSRAATWDYYYGAAETQELTGDYAAGVTATFQVEHPKQVRNGHSLAEMAVSSPSLDYTYIEAGWIVTRKQQPQLFIFWWDQGTPECYNQGCGYVSKGPGIQPGSVLQKGSTVTLAWQQKHGKWWLIVNGKKSGYYPDDQWSEDFSSTGFAQVFGEVAVKDGTPICTDMGNGKLSTKAKAASITDVAFIDGPAMQLVKDTDNPEHNYTVDVTSDTSARYGGPGDC